MTDTKRISRLPVVLLAIASLIGLACSIYLTQHFYEIRNGSAGFKSACNVSASMNCDVVAASKYAEFLGGIPLSAFAAGWYLALLGIAAISLLAEYAREAARVAFVMALVAVVNTLYYFSLMAGPLHTYCLFCLVIDGANILLFISALLMKPARPTQTPVDWSQWRNLSFMVAGALLVAIVLLKGFDTGQAPSVPNDELAQSILSSPAVAVSAGNDLPSIGGDPSSPVTIVEFSDFQCPFCRIAAVSLNTLMNRYPGKIRLVFKNFPLNSECNSKFPQTMHPYACEAARMAVCAHKQGKFKEVYENFFENQTQFAPGALSGFAKDAGVDLVKLSECVAGSEANLQIQRDVAEGNQLGVQSTPTLFFNGHKVEGAIPLGAWSKMVDDTLRKL